MSLVDANRTCNNAHRSVTGADNPCRFSGRQMIRQGRASESVCSRVPSAPRPSYRPNCWGTPVRHAAHEGSPAHLAACRHAIPTPHSTHIYFHQQLTDVQWQHCYWQYFEQKCARAGVISSMSLFISICQTRYKKEHLEVKLMPFSRQISSNNQR